MGLTHLIRRPKTWHKIVMRIAKRFAWALRLHKVLGQHDHEGRVAPEASRGLRERDYFYTAISDDALCVRADVLGFLPEELEVRIESRRLTIAGRRTITEHRRIDKIIYLDQCPNLMLRILQLPVQVEPNQSTATLRGGILEVSLPRAFPQPGVLHRSTDCQCPCTCEFQLPPDT